MAFLSRGAPPFEARLTTPERSSFVSLEEHQSQTPGTFFGGTPVLYALNQNVQLLVMKAHLEAHQDFFSFYKGSPASNGLTVNGTAAVPSSETILIPNVDAWVTSERLILFCNDTQTGVDISYPTITLHAVQRRSLPGVSPDTQVQSLYMQLDIHNPDEFSPEEADELETLEITLISGVSAGLAGNSSSSGASAGRATAVDASAPDLPIQALFSAITACQDLHPDPQSDSEMDEDAVDNFPGAGGWITSESMSQYFDENGQFIGGAPLGAGAGSVRPRDGDGEDEGDIKESEDDPGTKWQRTD